MSASIAEKASDEADVSPLLFLKDEREPDKTVRLFFRKSRKLVLNLMTFMERRCPRSIAVVWPRISSSALLSREGKELIREYRLNLKSIWTQIKSETADNEG
jgi:hypothetical protein